MLTTTSSADHTAPLADVPDLSAMRVGCSTSTAFSPRPPSSTCTRGRDCFRRTSRAREKPRTPTRTTSPTSTASPATTASAACWPAGASSSRKGTRPTRRQRKRCTGLGNQKNVAFANTLEVDGVTPYATSVAFLEAVEAAGCRVAVVSSSRNARAVLQAAGLLDRFEVIVDGNYAEAERLPGKPAPDTYACAAALLGVPTTDCAVVEDAESGVEAGAAGDFGVVDWRRPRRGARPPCRAGSGRCRH